MYCKSLWIKVSAKCINVKVWVFFIFSFSYPHQVYTYLINTVKTVILWNIITVFSITIAGNCCNILNILWLIRWRIIQTSFWRSRLIDVFYSPSQTTFLSLFTFVLGFRSAKMVFKTRCEVIQKYSLQNLPCDSNMSWPGKWDCFWTQSPCVSHCLHEPLTYHNKSPQYCPIHDRLWFRDDHQTSLFMDQPVTGGASLKGACQPGV